MVSSKCVSHLKVLLKSWNTKGTLIPLEYFCVVWKSATDY